MVGPRTHETPSPGALTLVATPLGNLGDVSDRARATLGAATVIYCEDTRRTRVLLSALGIAGGGRLRSLHQHNEAALAAAVVDEVAAGRQVALVSDAGTPTISDPGRRVVQAVAEAGLRVTTVPGPSAVVAALSVSGLDTDRFVMEGFVPRRGPERRARLAAWRSEPRTIVFYESPQRLLATLRELREAIGDRRVAIARELTKIHEEVVRGSVSEVLEHWPDAEVRGEVVVVVAGAASSEIAASTTPDAAAVRAALAARLEAGDSVRDAAARVAAELGVSRRDAYGAALLLRPGSPA